MQLTLERHADTPGHSQRRLIAGNDQADQPRQVQPLDAMADELLINCTHDTVLRFLPPYIITEKEVDRGLKILGRILAKVK